MERKSRFRKYAERYLTVNGLFLLPAVFMVFFVFFIPAFPVNIYFIVVLLYYVLGFTFLHLALDAGFLAYSIQRFVKERNRHMFTVSVSVIVFNAAANIMWIRLGSMI